MHVRIANNELDDKYNGQIAQCTKCKKDFPIITFENTRVSLENAMVKDTSGIKKFRWQICIAIFGIIIMALSIAGIKKHNDPLLCSFPLLVGFFLFFMYLCFPQITKSYHLSKSQLRLPWRC